MLPTRTRGRRPTNVDSGRNCTKARARHARGRRDHGRAVRGRDVVAGLVDRPHGGRVRGRRPRRRRDDARSTRTRARTDRHTEKLTERATSRWADKAGRRLDVLASDGTGQTIVAWPARPAGHGVRAACVGPRRRGRARRAGPVRRILNARVAPMSDRPGDWEARRRTWRVERVAPSLDRLPERRERFTTLGDLPGRRPVRPVGRGRDARRRGAGPRWPDRRRPPRRPAPRGRRPVRGRRPAARRRPPGRAARSRAASTRPATGRGRGRCACSRASGRPRTRTRGSASSSTPGRPGSRSPTTCRRCTATTPTTRRPRASSAPAGSPSAASPTWSCCSRACRSTA